MEYSSLDKKIINSWRIARLIRLIVVGVLIGVPTLIFSFQSFFEAVAPYVLWIEATILVYLVITPFLYPYIEYKQWKYKITEDRVEIRRGIFFISTVVIPIVRIQHIAIEQGPINRKLGLSRVNINTASGSFSIEGLADDVARDIVDALKAKLYTRLEAQEG